MARADAFAAVLLALPWTDGCAGNLAHHRGEDHVALEPYCAPLQCLGRDHERGHAAFHVRNPETLHLIADDPPFELRFRLEVGDHAQIIAGAREARIGMAVEPEAEPGSVTL